MTLAYHLQDFDVRSSCAIAPHRGDVTTVMAAVAVRLRAERQAEEARRRHRPHGAVHAVRSDTTGH